MLKTRQKKLRQKNINPLQPNGDLKISGINREFFCGAIDLKIEPVAYQRKIRNDWK